MNRALIVARMQPGAQDDIGRIFAASDTTSLPTELGVLRRSLYSFHGIYIHLMDMADRPSSSIAAGRELSAFKKISEDLEPFIGAYDPVNWRSPLDAVATEFYSWEAAGNSGD